MANDTITITLKLFAIYQETLGVPEQEMTLPGGATVGDVLNRILEADHSLTKWKDLTRFGLNLQFVEAGTVLHNGDELVLIPPVSGG